MLVTVLLCILNAALVGVLIGIFVVVKGAFDKSSAPLVPSDLDHLASQYADALPESFLPAKFAVSKESRFITTNQGGRGTCWAFATIYLLESQYRAQGIRQGYLKENEYVNLSVQAFVAFAGNWCVAHPTAKVCGYGGFLHNTTNDNQVEAFPEFVKAIEELRRSIVPESVCPYNSSQGPESDFWCDNLSDALKRNPIEFEIKSFRTAFDNRAMKQLVLSANRPIGIGTPVGNTIYFVQCSTAGYENRSNCVKKLFPCPDHEGEFCERLSVGGSTREGVFTAPANILGLVEGGGHAMNVVGYNDNWRYNNRFAGPDTLATMQGTFILHNSWGSGGHSIEYLMGERTLENEEATCPNANDPLNWIPATFEDAVEQKGDYKKMSTGTGLRRVRGHGYTEHADGLWCSGGKGWQCEENHRYVLSADNDDIKTYALPNGLHVTELIDITNATDIKTIHVTYPFQSLGDLFGTLDKIVPNDPHNCGYYALPYQTLEVLRSRSWDLFDNYKSSDIEVEFKPSSYLRAPEFAAENKDPTYLQLSTWTNPEVTFDGPVPFNLVYL